MCIDAYGVSEWWVNWFDMHWCGGVSWSGLSLPPLAGRSLNVRISLSQLYGSSVAVSVVCQAVCNMALTRAMLCRDLLILQQFYLRLGDNVSTCSLTLSLSRADATLSLNICLPHSCG